MSTLRRDPGLWLLLHLRPPGDGRRDEHGICAVCGSATRLVYNGWILSRHLRRIGPPGLTRRESLFCTVCGSSRRVRLLAAALVELYADEASCVAELVREGRFRGLVVAEINAAGRMHPYLAAHPRLTHVEYPEEDVQALSWADGSFDLVLTSETLEHVPDLHGALREIHRVLRPGGRHVFTVPVDSRLVATRSRDGQPEVHHGRGGGPFALVTRKQDMLARWDVGRDLPALLEAAGFAVEDTGSGADGVYVARAL